mgnify:CR=1 FL=1
MRQSFKNTLGTIVGGLLRILLHIAKKITGQ